MKILIVDDDAELRDLLRVFLASKGHDVDTAPDGDQALRLIDENKYDLAFLDFSMPKITGLQIVEHMKAHKCKTRTIVITAYPLMKDFLVNTIGADEYLSKPFRLEEVDGLLQKYVAVR